MIPTSYFHKQAMRLVEAEKWFLALTKDLLASVKEVESSLDDYTGAWPLLAACYQTKEPLEGNRTFQLENGNVKLELELNNPIGWITATVTKTYGFEKKTFRGAISAEYVSASLTLKEPDHYVLKSIGFFSELSNVRAVSDKLSAVLFESELTEDDCIATT